MKILYITAQTPWGKGETFILEEMLEVKHQGIDLLIIPRNPPKEIFHKEAKELLENAIWLPLINPKIIIYFLGSLFTNFSIWKILVTILGQSRNFRIALKNIAVVPKGIFITKIIKKEKIEHIHAHWGSTTSTMAYIISQLTGISWSFTLHRWDIAENNMLKKKVNSAKFVRIISKHGKNELLEIIGEKEKNKIKVIHMGIRTYGYIEEFIRDNIFEKFTIITPANLVEVKGHKYLIEACSNLVGQGIINFQCIFYGNGPLRNELDSLIKEKKLVDYIIMPGILRHEDLIRKYQNKEVDLVILPSITTKDGEHEGIPVALMEAMAYRIPVVSTSTGSIDELLSNGAGIIIEEKSSEQLAKTILKVMEDANFRKLLIEKEYQKVKAEFDIEENTKILLELIEESL